MSTISSNTEPPTWWQFPPLLAANGPACEPPPATHVVRDYIDLVFRCQDHLVTALQSPEDDAAIVLTPDHVLDFRAGEAKLDFELSTFGAHRGNQVDLWVTPYEDGRRHAIVAASRARACT